MTGLLLGAVDLDRSFLRHFHRRGHLAFQPPGVLINVVGRLDGVYMERLYDVTEFL